MMPTDYFAQIAEHAESTPAQEVCGFLLLDGKGSLEVMRVPNVAGDTSLHWQMPPTAYLQAKNTGKLIAMYHSHPDIQDSDENPSHDDLRCSNNADLPMFIYSLKTKRFSYHRSPALIRPFEGRQFIVGVQDCVSLVVDYYQVNWGVKLPFVLRTPDVIEKGFSRIDEFLNDIMVKVSPESLVKDDLVTFAIGNDGRENHVGIYVGDGRILHQLQGRVSDYQTLHSSWRSRIVNVLRLR